jgi:4-amino-4-deoxy-L-arabinose transferase
MENLFAGIVTILVATTFFFFSWKAFRQQQTNLSLFLLVLGGLTLRVFLSADLYLHEWDERYHALVAKNLMQNPLNPCLYSNPLFPFDYKEWTGNHIWLHKQPLALWTMALSLYCFGVNELALRLPTLILSSLTIVLVFKIGHYLFNKRVAYFAAFLFAINGLVIELGAGKSPTDHIDIFFLFFITLAIYLGTLFIETQKHLINIFVGIALGLAILSKWLPALIVLPVYFLLLLASKQFSFKQSCIHLLIAIVTCTAVALPWQIFIFLKYPIEAAYESSFNFFHLTAAVETHKEPFLYHFNILRIAYGELVYIPCGWFFYKALKNRKNLKHIALLAWFIIPFAVFTVAQTKMPAYTLIAAPAIFIMCGLFADYLLRNRLRFRYQWIPVSLLAGLLILPIRYSIERIKPFSIESRKPSWANDIYDLQLDPKKPNVVFNSKHPIETMFYRDCTAYPFIPSLFMIAQLEQKGYNIVILK